MNENDLLLRNVQAKSFLAHDLLLYLDTHPDDPDAYAAYRRALCDRLTAVRAYEQQERSLTPDGIRGADFDWVGGDEPWQ